MTISSAERQIRAALPLIRFMQPRLPLPIANWLIQQGVAHVRLEPGVIQQPVSANNVPCHWLIPQNSPANRALLYLHGGGFVFGLSPQHLQMGAWLAQKMHTRILMADYRLAPDAPFPAALDDSTAAYHWLLQQGIPAQNIVVAGDSAGGNLTLTLLLKLRDSGEPLPAAAACLSPVTDLSRDHAHPEHRDPLLSPRAMQLYTRSYVGNHDARDPWISPVFGDLRGLPPLLIYAGEDEILRADALQITEVAQAAGVDVRLEIAPRLWHVWQLFLELPQARQSLEDIAQFLSSHIGGRQKNPVNPVNPV
ncbi:MAG: alpha/beta hydrolase [Anaerolineae bacterium]|jgi:acetyl esterase/lipase|nr:alpha/beta hydrolase [Anaerolineae bacterium]